MTIRFGVGIATCREGRTYPPGFMQPGDFVTVAQRAEQLGFDSVWGDDHLTTIAAANTTAANPLSFYEPLITFALLAGVTTRLRFVVGVIVLPMREPVLLAKQVATLDALSGGRVTLAVGLGGSRAEFETVRPDLVGAHRGALMDEGIVALRRLLNQPRASFEGKYLRFGEVEIAPRPVQRPFPIYVNARERAGLQRVARLADGWLVAGLAPARMATARDQLDAAAREVGRDPASIRRCFQLWAGLGRDRAEAEAKLKRSRYFQWMVRRQPDHSEEALVEQFRAQGLLGDPGEVIEQLQAYQQAGAAEIGIVFLNETVGEMLGDLELFAERVIPRFAGG